MLSRSGASSQRWADSNNMPEWITKEASVLSAYCAPPLVQKPIVQAATKLEKFATLSPGLA
jgi:hypothetical protein